MGVTVSNLLMGPAKLYTAVVGSTESVSNAVALAAAWTDAGGTEGGCTLTIDQTFAPLGPIDQIVIAAGARRTAVGVQVKTNLAEATLANLRVALNQAVNAATFTEIDGDAANVDPNYQAVCIEGMRPGGAGPRRVFVRRTLSTNGIGIPFQKDGMTLIPVTFEAYYVSSSVKVARVDDTP